MTYKERIEALKTKIKAKIIAESTPEEIEEWNSIIAELDEVNTIHESLEVENSKFKDTIVRMVTSEGNNEKPKDNIDGSKPMTIQEAFAEVEKGVK